MPRRIVCLAVALACLLATAPAFAATHRPTGTTTPPVPAPPPLPASWVLLYYAFIAHVWFSLGRWPRFGERLDGWFISFHDETIRYFFGALVASLYVAPFVLIGCLFLRRYRHVSVYSLCYGASVGLASCALFLAPHAFLNWFFD